MRAENIQAPLRRFELAAETPHNRLVRFNPSGLLVLCGSSDEDAVGATQAFRSPASSCGPGRPGPVIAMRSAVSSYVLTALGTVPRGVVFRAAGGKVAATGSVREGVAITTAADGEPVEVVPG